VRPSKQPAPINFVDWASDLFALTQITRGRRGPNEIAPIPLLAESRQHLSRGSVKARRITSNIAKLPDLLLKKVRRLSLICRNVADRNLCSHELWSEERTSIVAVAVDA